MRSTEQRASSCPESAEENKSCSIVVGDRTGEERAVSSHVYRGEGNANLVIALPYEHKIIRFRKSLPGEASPDGGAGRVQREVKFVSHVASCFLGSYVQIPEILRYDARHVASLSEAIRAARPDHRRDKDITEVEYATKYPDYTFLSWDKDQEEEIFRNASTFCVEIKPKQGYLSKAEWNFQKCPYCLMQFYKLKKEDIHERSTYCPFDLFSGEKRRMRKALKGLLKNPQNNLKIFKDGIVVYGEANSSSSNLQDVLADCFGDASAIIAEKSRNLELFCDLVCAALLRPFCRGDVDEEPKQQFFASESLCLSETNTSFYYIDPSLIAETKKLLCFTQEECDFTADKLPKGAVLERIFNMQRVCYCSTERAYNIYRKYLSHLREDKNEELRPATFLDLMEVYGSMKSFSKSNAEEKKETEGQRSIEKFVDTNKSKDGYTGDNAKRVATSKSSDCTIDRLINEETSESLLLLRNYLLFSTARDCSILMSFRELNQKEMTSLPEEHLLKIAGDLRFVCNVRISDLDPKRVGSIEKHYRRDANVLKSVVSVLEDELTVRNR